MPTAERSSVAFGMSINSWPEAVTLMVFRSLPIGSNPATEYCDISTAAEERQ